MPKRRRFATREELIELLARREPSVYWHVALGALQAEGVNIEILVEIVVDELTPPLRVLPQKECAVWMAGMSRSCLECAFCDPLWCRVDRTTADMARIWAELVEHLAQAHAIVPDPAGPPPAQSGANYPSSWYAAPGQDVR